MLAVPEEGRDANSQASSFGSRKSRQSGVRWGFMKRPIPQAVVRNPTQEPELTGSSPTPNRKSGEIVAVLLSILLSMVTLTGAHWWSAADAGMANMKLLWLASWLPSGLRIGPYAGKEMAALIVWLGSWAILHILLKRWEAQLQRWIYIFIAVVFILLVLLWPPIYHDMFGWPV
jgi:hypothetical protein